MGYLFAFVSGKAIKTVIRFSSAGGRKVDGACGQLALKSIKDLGVKPDLASADGCEDVTDIEDLLPKTQGGVTRQKWQSSASLPTAREGGRAASAESQISPPRIRQRRPAASTEEYDSPAKED